MTRPQLVLIVFLLAPAAVAQESARDNIGHRRHLHRHNQPHPTTATSAERFVTDRQGHPLRLPAEEDAFTFAVFGDRTGGPAVGVAVLADAVRDVNLLEPDLVMTVGDLIQGYDQEGPWLRQMREYRAIMDQLLCPWFPVAGNHDVYYRGPDMFRPKGEHDANYEMHFGPLWYAFEHKNCWFIVLYTDEGDPETGQKTFRTPDAQKMSSQQFAWLKETLGKAVAADHVFLFVHHPRWLGRNYGSDWDRVHDLLVQAGNVTAVFAGHIHRMRSDAKDGIDYVTLATVGGHQPGIVPSAGFLHHFDLVTVRRQQVALASIPVGQVMDVREITGEMMEETVALAQQVPVVAGQLPLKSDGSSAGTVTLTLRNPTRRPVEATLVPASGDSRWRFAPDHQHQTLAPGEDWTAEVQVLRGGGVLDQTFRTPELVASLEYLADGARYPIPDLRVEMPMRPTLAPGGRPATERVLSLNGRDQAVRVASEAASLPDGAFTAECWFRANRYGRRVGLVSKAESSEYGIFVSNGIPNFSVLIGQSYLEVAAESPVLKTDTWHHIAGVYDGTFARLYVDGRLVSKAERSGVRRTNTHPLLIGADVDGRGQPVSFFDGEIDAVRLSRVARYTGETFTPQRRVASDAETNLLLNMDSVQGVWLFDESPQAAHPRLIGTPQVK